MISYQDWKKQQIEKGEWAGFDQYRREFPEVKEYVCVYLNPKYKLAHDEDAEILFATDNLAEAGGFIYNLFKKEKRDIAVWQERSRSYREIYRNQPRDSKGRFTKI